MAEMNMDFDGAWTWAAVVVRDKEGNTVVWQVDRPHGSIRTSVEYQRVATVYGDSPKWIAPPDISVEMTISGRLLQPPDPEFRRELEIRAKQHPVRSLNDEPWQRRKEEE